MKFNELVLLVITVPLASTVIYLWWLVAAGAATSLAPALVFTACSVIGIGIAVGTAGVPTGCSDTGIPIGAGGV
jgi:hypothetical protein